MPTTNNSQPILLHSHTINASLLLVPHSSTYLRARPQAQKETQEITHVSFVEPGEVPASWWKGSHFRSPDAAALFDAGWKRKTKVMLWLLRYCSSLIF
jgi:hypothetical protein